MNYVLAIKNSSEVIKLCFAYLRISLSANLTPFSPSVNVGFTFAKTSFINASIELGLSNDICFNVDCVISALTISGKVLRNSVGND